MFEDFDVMAGDQGAPPVDDEFGEDLLGGDQAAGFDDMPDDEGDFDMDDNGDDYYDEEEPKPVKKEPSNAKPDSKSVPKK